VNISTDLRLRPLRVEDEEAFRAGHDAMAADGFTFGFGLEPGLAWNAYLKMVEDASVLESTPPGLVPATFLIADIAGQIVGRTSIRQFLNDHLEQFGGHIGYGVLREYRRRGYATEILRQSLIIARSVGVERVLVTCDEDNLGSSRVIEACGGQLENIVNTIEGMPRKRRYWIG